MEINWLIVIPVAVAAVALLYFLIRQNQKDEKVVEKEMNTVNKTDEAEANDPEDNL